MYQNLVRSAPAATGVFSPQTVWPHYTAYKSTSQSQRLKGLQVTCTRGTAAFSKLKPSSFATCFSTGLTGCCCRRVVQHELHGSMALIKKKNLATLRGSDGQGEGPVFIQGGIRGVRHFPKKNARKMAIAACPCAFRLRRLAQNVQLTSGARHFFCNFPHKMALVTCPCAFRLRRLARTARPDLGMRHL